MNAVKKSLANQVDNQLKKLTREAEELKKVKTQMLRPEKDSIDEDEMQEDGADDQLDLYGDEISVSDVSDDEEESEMTA